MVREAEACTSLPKDRSKSSLISSILQTKPKHLEVLRGLLKSVANRKGSHLLTSYLLGPGTVVEQ